MQIPLIWLSEARHHVSKASMPSVNSLNFGTIFARPFYCAHTLNIFQGMIRDTWTNTSLIFPVKGDLYGNMLHLFV